MKVIKNHAEWDSFLKVCEYFKTSPKPNLYIRDLPISVHTKFIENNKAVIKELLDILISEHINREGKEFEKRFHLKSKEFPIRFKVLDKAISQKYFSGIDHFAIPLSQFETINLPLEQVLVVENKTTLYTTLTLPNMHRTIAIFGSGYSVYNLKNVEWLSTVKLFYWGDIDVQGFKILSQFSPYFPHTQSLLMDEMTFEQFFKGDSGTPTNTSVKLNLTKEEQQVYNKSKTNNWRLEQENIPLHWVKK